MIDHVEREIREKFGIEAVIHMDPIVVDGDTEEMRTLVENVVKAYTPTPPFTIYALPNGIKFITYTLT